MSGALDDATRATVARHADLPTPTAMSTFLRLLGVALGVLIVSSVAVASFIVIDVLNRVGDGAVALEDEDGAKTAAVQADDADKDAAAGAADAAKEEAKPEEKK